MNWTFPNIDQMYSAIDSTWAPATISRVGKWTLRDGAGGGKRVSAATLVTRAGEVCEADVLAAASAMHEINQTPLFMLRKGEFELDNLLNIMGYLLIDPVVLFAAPIEKIANYEPQSLRAIPCEIPLARQAEIWKQGGIGLKRLAVMARVKGPKTHLISRFNDRPAGTGFVACDGKIAMLHALEILESKRRNGLGRDMTYGAAHWAKSVGAEIFALMATVENQAATTLYREMGMVEIGHYHYRVA